MKIEMDLALLLNQNFAFGVTPANRFDKRTGGKKQKLFPLQDFSLPLRGGDPGLGGQAGIRGHRRVPGSQPGKFNTYTFPQNNKKYFLKI